MIDAARVLPRAKLADETLRYLRDDVDESGIRAWRPHSA